MDFLLIVALLALSERFHLVPCPCPVLTLARSKDLVMAGSRPRWVSARGHKGTICDPRFDFTPRSGFDLVFVSLARFDRPRGSHMRSGVRTQATRKSEGNLQWLSAKCLILLSVVIVSVVGQLQCKMPITYCFNSNEANHTYTKAFAIFIGQFE
jgi:hypothetical protein